MPANPKPPKNNKGKKKRVQNSSREGRSSTSVGNISGGKGFAIGPYARAIVIEIKSLFDLSVLQQALKHHWLFLTINLSLQGIFAGIWKYYTDRFLIPVWMLIMGMILLEIILISIYILAIQPKQRQIISTVGITSLVGLAGLTNFEYNRIVHPQKFDVEVFGVAVAQFGEGSDLRNTEQARDVSQAVLQQLTQQAQENPDLRFVQFKPIGLVRTAREASEDGQRIGADLVIWGRLQVSEEKTILNFSILETPDKVSNPMFPRVLPLFEPAASGFIRIGSRGGEEIAKGTTTISAFTFGLAHFFKWDFGDAARAFEEAPITSLAEGDDYRYMLHLYYGLSLQWPGQLEKADEEFQKAIDIHPDDPAPRIARAFGYNSLGRIEEAQENALTALRLCSDRILLDPHDYRAFFDRALTHEILKDWESALADYQAAKQNAPDLFTAHIGIIRMHLMLDQLPEAIQAAQEAIKLAESRDANPAWAYLHLAHAYERSKDVANTRLAYQKTTQLAPEIDWIHFQAGSFYSGTGDPQDLLAAEQEYKTMIQVSGNPAWAHSNLADFYARHNRLNEAVAEYHMALQTNPEIGGLWISLADVFNRLERHDEAKDAYERAIKFEPNNFYAYFAYGNYLFTQGELEDAIRRWETAHQINPRHCGLLLNIGQAYETLGDQQHAKTIYRLALSNEVEPDQDCQGEATRRLSHALRVTIKEVNDV